MFKAKQLFSNQGVGRYFTNTVWLLAEKGLRIIDAFFIGIWLARYLGPDDFGVFSYCLLYTSPSPRDQRGSRMPSSA